jgi:hypothetical protein
MGMPADKVADIELNARPALMEDAKRVYTDMAAGNQDSYAKAVEMLGKPKVDAYLASYKRSIAPANPATAPAAAAPAAPKANLNTGFGVRREMQPGNTFAERQASALENSKKAAADPELLELDRKRAASLRAGKPVEANESIKQYNQLKRERYGL